MDELLDRLVVHLLVGPYVAQRPIPIGDLASLATDAVLDAFEFSSLQDDHVARRVGNDVIDSIDVLELAGVVCRSGAREGADGELSVSRRRLGGTVELTPAGVTSTHRILADAGYEAPTAGCFVAATATELLVGTDREDFTVVWGEIEAWRRRLQPAEAARQWADAVTDLADPALRNLALAVLGDMEPAVAVPLIRQLATEPDSRAAALCWLVDHGLEDHEVLFDPDDLAWFLDVLAQRLVGAGPEAMCDTLALAGSHERQVHVIGQLWRSPSSATDAVLAAVGETHPARAVAKAARKARFQRRSWGGG